MKPFDPTKPVQTRDGRPARIIATDANIRSGRDLDTIVALVKGPTGESLHSYQENGHYIWPGSEVDSDLINIPEETVEFFNVYPTGTQGDSHAFISAWGADEGAKDGPRLNPATDSFTIKVTKVDGEVTEVSLA